jgi:hypothetical protein
MARSLQSRPAAFHPNLAGRDASGPPHSGRRSAAPARIACAPAESIISGGRSFAPHGPPTSAETAGRDASPLYDRDGSRPICTGTSKIMQDGLCGDSSVRGVRSSAPRRSTARRPRLPERWTHQGTLRSTSSDMSGVILATTYGREGNGSSGGFHTSTRRSHSTMLRSRLGASTGDTSAWRRSVHLTARRTATHWDQRRPNRAELLQPGLSSRPKGPMF